MPIWRKYPRNLKVLIIAIMINSTGMAFLWPLHTIYITHKMGITLTEAGFVLMLHSAAEIIGSFLGGYLYDRIRGKKTLLFAILISALFIFIISIGLSWPIYIVSMILLGIGIGAIFPPIYALTGIVWKEGGNKSFSLIYQILNFGTAVGTALGGIVAQYSFRYVFWLNGLTYLLFIVVIWWGLDEPVPNEELNQKKRSQFAQKVEFLKTPSFLSLLFLCFGFMFCWITYIQWQTSISNYIHQLGFSLSVYSSLWTINGFIILLGQPFFLWSMIRLNVSVKWQLIIGVALFMLTFAVLSVSNAYQGFLIGMIIMTIGEILIFPVIPGIADQMAPLDKRGMYQGIVSGTANIGKTIGPLLGGILYDSYGPMVLLYSCIFICGFALICFGTYQRLQYTKFQSNKVTVKGG
ncbi:MFS transporter [Bacillus salipaludis]|uniref:MDR family MFS transporter n=1 Tax=Bacillus salipaludis TaxID=2547811 RepID=UPI002E1D1F32|nr:MFS transporter [Bacillus salipaludis]